MIFFIIIAAVVIYLIYIANKEAKEKEIAETNKLIMEEKKRQSDKDERKQLLIDAKNKWKDTEIYTKFLNIIKESIFIKSKEATVKFKPENIMDVINVQVTEYNISLVHGYYEFLNHSDKLESENQEVILNWKFSQLGYKTLDIKLIWSLTLALLEDLNNWDDKPANIDLIHEFPENENIGRIYIDFEKCYKKLKNVFD